MKGKAKYLTTEQLKALELFKKRVSDLYSISSVIVFGSAARGEAEEDSDLDVLLITKKQLAHKERHDVYNIATKLNWEFDTNISVTIVDKSSWEHGLYSIMQIKEEVQQDGVAI